MRIEEMGNTIEVKLKEEKPVLEVTEALVGELKEYIRMADHSMAGLANSLDAMRDACEMLLRQLDKEHQLQDATTDTDSAKVNNKQLARHLLEMIDASVSHNRYVVMKSLSKLFSFVWDEGKSNIDIADNSSVEFLVDKCISNRDSVGIENVDSYTDIRIRALQREMKILQDKYTASKQELKNLNMREVQYRKEIEILEKKNTTQKKKTENLTGKQNCEVEDLNEANIRDDNNEITDLKKEINRLKQENEEVRTNMKIRKDVAEECLNRKEQKINEFEQELQNLKINNSRKIPSAADEVTSMEDFKRLGKENKMREEIDRLNQELASLKTYKILDDKETSMDGLEGLIKDTDIRDEIDRLNQEITALKTNKVLHDKETSMDGSEGLIKDTDMRDEIDRLNQEITALKTNKVLDGFEYDGWTFIRPTFFEREIKKDIYQTLESELATCSIRLRIFPWRPSNIIGFPTDKVIIVPINVFRCETLNDMMQRALAKIKAGPNIVVLVFYDADRPQIWDEVNKHVGEEFDSLGGIFKFGHSCRKQHITDMNDKNFEDLLQFFQSKCLEGMYLSR